MVAISDRSSSTGLKRYWRWVVRGLVVGIIGYGVVMQGRAVAGLFGIGGTAGRLAKVQFRLKESFYPTSVTWSPNGRYIATGSTSDVRIDIWDVSQRKIIKVLLRKFPPASFHDLSWSPNGQYLAFCDVPGVLRLYWTSDWSQAHVFGGPPEHTGCTQSAFSTDSSRVALLGTHFLGVYSVPDWRTVTSLNLSLGWGRGDLFKTLAYLPDSHTVLVGGGQYVTIAPLGKKQGSWDGRVWFFNEADRVPRRSIRAYLPAGIHGGGGDTESLATSPEGRYLVTGANTGAGDPSSGLVLESIHVFNSSTGALVAAPLDDLQPLKFFGGVADAYTGDGRYIIVPHGGDDGWIHILDGRTFKVLDLVQSNAFNYDVAVNKLDDDFAVGTNKQVIVWSLPAR